MNDETKRDISKKWGLVEDILSGCAWLIDEDGRLTDPDGSNVHKEELNWFQGQLETALTLVKEIGLLETKTVKPDYKSFPVCGEPCPKNEQGDSIKCRECRNYKSPKFKKQFELIAEEMRV